MKRIALFLVVAFGSTGAFAHPQSSDALLHGFAHPFTGIDHLLAMLLVGLWAARRQGASRFMLPLAFIASILAGALLGRAGVLLPAVEPIVVASVVVFAAALAVRIRLTVGFMLVGAFGLFHGYTHSRSGLRACGG